MDVRLALKRQYHAAMAMLRQAIELCPEGLWTEPVCGVPYWRVVYHTLYYTHLYLLPNPESFKPVAGHKDQANSLSGPPMDPLFSAADLLDYWAVCDLMINKAIDEQDLDAQESGFFWYAIPRLDFQINNIRHIQHHAGSLCTRLRQTGEIDIPWSKG